MPVLVFIFGASEPFRQFLAELRVYECQNLEASARLNKSSVIINPSRIMKFGIVCLPRALPQYIAFPYDKERKHLVASDFVFLRIDTTEFGTKTVYAIVANY